MPPFNVTRWSPDTCKCVIEYRWDTALPEAARVHVLNTYVFKCSFHQALPDAAAYTKVGSENQTKNLALLEAKNIGLDPDTIIWSFDAQRRVVLTVPNITPAQRGLLTTALNARFGTAAIVA